MAAIARRESKRLPFLYRWDRGQRNPAAHVAVVSLIPMALAGFMGAVVLFPFSLLLVGDNLFDNHAGHGPAPLA